MKVKGSEEPQGSGDLGPEIKFRKLGIIEEILFYFSPRS